MKKRMALIGMALVVLLSMTGAVAAHDGGGKDHPGRSGGGARRVAILRGAEEVPGPGDPDGAGFAIIRARPNKGQVCYELFVSGIEPATAAHIHAGAAGATGPIVVNFTPPTNGYSKGCVTDLDKEVVRNIRRNPDQYYVNVHNAVYPPGALRGQLFQTPIVDEHESED